MFYRYSVIDYIWMMMIFWAALAPLIVLGVMSDKIDISVSNDYLDEYNQCQQDLENTQPICPACKCSAGFSQLFYFVGGVIIMFWFYDLALFPIFFERNIKKLGYVKSRKEVPK